MMKWLRYSLWIAGFVILLLWLAQHAVPSGGSSEPRAAAQLLPPAPYPVDLEQQLARLQDADISLQAESELPPDLPWQSSSDAPPVGSLEARRGGTLRLCNVGPFPSNFLAFGSVSPQFFHYNLFERIDIPLVWEHPATGQEMPGLAEAWCVHGGSVFFRLNPQARYSNGRPVRARDFALGALLRRKAGIVPGFKPLRIYGDSVVEVSLTGTGIEPVICAARLLHPAEPGFYADFSGNYAELYAQRIPPTTGAYTVSEIQRGRLIALERVPNWWGDSLPAFRHMYNIQRIEHHFLADEAQAWEMFRNGRLDIMQTRNIAAWQTKPESIPAAQDGRIALHCLRLQCPMPPYGIALNAQALPEVELRRGIMQALDMDKVVEVLFRGYAERLRHFSSGYRQLTHSTDTYSFNPAAARACFARAGYTEAGADGILRRPDGTRLSVRFSFTPSDKLNTIASLLAQSAAACGLELIPEPLPWQNISKQLREGSHQLTFWATMPDYLLPEYERFFHSSATGFDAPFRLNSPEMDAAIARVKQACTPDEAAAACAQVDAIIHREAIWLPGWMENHALIATWQHVHIPQHYSGPYDIAESHQLWVSP